MVEILLLKEDLQKLKYNNVEGENLFEDKLFQESDIKRLDKEMYIPFEIDFFEGNNFYQLDCISRLYFHNQEKSFDYYSKETDEEFIDFNSEEELLTIDITETISYEVMFKMKKTIKIGINSKVSFVIFLKNCSMLISVQEMYVKNNVKILKIFRTYFENFPIKTENESCEKEIYIANNELYYVNDNKEYGGKNTDIPSNTYFYIYYDKGQFVASTNLKDCCYLCIRNTSIKFSLFVEDEIILCKFNEEDFIPKKIKFSDRNSKKYINNQNQVVFLQNRNDNIEITLPNPQLKKMSLNNLNKPSHIGSSSGFQNFENESGFTYIDQKDNQFNTHLNFHKPFSNNSLNLPNKGENENKLNSAFGNQYNVQNYKVPYGNQNNLENFNEHKPVNLNNYESNFNKLESNKAIMLDKTIIQYNSLDINYNPNNDFIRSNANSVSNINNNNYNVVVNNINNLNTNNNKNINKINEKANYNLNINNNISSNKEVNLKDINEFQLLNNSNENNIQIANVYNIDDFSSYKKLSDIKKKEKERSLNYCRYCNYSKRADYFLHPECRSHKLDDNRCIKCDHIICKDCSINYKRCFFDNEIVNKFERI